MLSRLVFGSIIPNDTNPNITTPAHHSVNEELPTEDHDGVPQQVEKPAPVPKSRPSSTTPSSHTSEKENETAPRKRKGTGSRSGTNNRRTGGGSDDEIAKLGVKERQAAELKLPERSKKPGSEGVTDSMTREDKLTVVRWITTEEKWKDWKLKQHGYWITVRSQASTLIDSL